MTSESNDGSPGALLAELSDLARARNRLELQPDRFPTLAGLASEPTVDAIFDVVDQAIARLDQAPQRAAASLLADTPDRWSQNLKARSTVAAGHLGIGSYHTFRDRRNGSSPSDDLLMAVAHQLVVSDPGTAQTPTTPAIETTDEADENTSSPTTPGPARSKRRPLLVLAMAAITLGAVAFVVTASSGEDAAVPAGPTVVEPVSITTAGEGTVGASEALPVDGCDIPLGGSTTPMPDQRAVATSVSEAIEAAGGVAMTGCPLHSIERWQSLWVQAFEGAALPPGSVLADDDGNAVWVEEGVVTGYRGGMSGSLQQVSGLPVGFRTAGTTQILELADGAFVVAEVPGNRAFWIAAEAADDWLAAGGASGGLGPPLTDPNFIDGRPEQHFRHGRIWEGEPGEAIVEIYDDAAIEAYLAELDEPFERLVRTFDSTAWWIDADGVRRWIPDGETWNCVGGADVVLEEESPGWVIGSFAVGPPMSCDA